MKQTNNTKNPRTRGFSLICYFETDFEIFQALNNIQDLQKFAFIRHDKDISQPHYHVALVTANGHTLTAISRHFKNNTNAKNCMIEELCSPKGIYIYFTHEEEDEEKYKYDVKDIITNDNEFFASAEFINDVCVDIINAMLNNVPTRDLVRFFGKHVVYNFKNFEYIVERIRKEER